jgi:hypothetical protein
MYVIGEKDGDAYWSNELGWVSLEDSDRFTREEQQTLRLPVGGYWITLWAVDATQFARLISECDAVGLFDEATLERLAESMDLEMSQVQSLVGRACEHIEQEKARLRG